LIEKVIEMKKLLLKSWDIAASEHGGCAPTPPAILIVPIIGILALAAIGITPFAIIGGILALFFGG